MIKALSKFMNYTIVTCTILLALCFAGTVQAQNQQPVSAPVVNLQIWNTMSEQEQYAFLAGFVSMLELEKEWQGQTGLLPLKQSMIGSWGMGMDGMTLKTIRNTVNTYSLNNLAQGNKIVLEVLWRECVQPKLGGTTPAAGRATSIRVQETMQNQQK